jgi:hypothetical protein
VSRLATIVLLAAAVAFWIQNAAAQELNPANQALLAEWQALALQQHHAEEAINRLIQSYEARLATAMDWLRQAQAHSGTAPNGVGRVNPAEGGSNPP